jgi:hypothetical protein
VTATQGPTSGSLITLRNNAGLDDFVVKGTGRIGVGISRGATPRGQVHIVQQPGARGRSRGTGRRRRGRRRRALRGGRRPDVARLERHRHPHRTGLSGGRAWS